VPDPAARRLYLSSWLAGACLTVFANPAHIGVQGLAPALLTLAAAPGLWMLGRRLAAKISVRRTHRAAAVLRADRRGRGAPARRAAGASWPACT
jgi:hypothetical protein